jgi:Protein of unknown function (DUF3592)
VPSGWTAFDAFPDERLVPDFISLSALVIVALSPLLRRIYIQRFWVRGRGTVIRLEGGISTNPGPGGGTWVWSPVIAYDAAGQRFSSRFSYWQSFNAKSKYAAGDEVEILYSPRNPSRFVLDSWSSWLTYLVLTIIISSVIVSAGTSQNPAR